MVALKYSYVQMLDNLVNQKSAREWCDIAHANNMTVKDYLDGMVLDRITRDYSHGIITAEEFDAIRKEWNV